MAKNIMLNFLIMLGPVLLAIWYPAVGSLAATLGSVGGLLVIYCLPTAVYLKQAWLAIENPGLVRAMR
jgi:hypothetical protein